MREWRQKEGKDDWIYEKGLTWKRLKVSEVLEFYRGRNDVIDLWLGGSFWHIKFEEGNGTITLKTADTLADVLNYYEQKEVKTQETTMEETKEETKELTFFEKRKNVLVEGAKMAAINSATDELYDYVISYLDVEHEGFGSILESKLGRETIKLTLTAGVTLFLETQGESIPGSERILGALNLQEKAAAFKGAEAGLDLARTFAGEKIGKMAQALAPKAIELLETTSTKLQTLEEGTVLDLAKEALKTPENVEVTEEVEVKEEVTA